MPGFILDVHGLGTTFKSLDGVINAVKTASFGLAEDETVCVVDQRDNPGLASDVIGVKDDRIEFHVASYAARSILKSARIEHDLSFEKKGGAVIQEIT
jgi:hypothetical protein